jgi:Domain of unknown function (DUF5916)
MFDLRCSSLIAVLCLGVPGIVWGAPDSKQLAAIHRDGQPFEIDGRLNEAAWTTAVFDDRFVAKRPREAAPPSERTEIAVVFDDQALIIGVRLAQPAVTIRDGLTRRDNYGDVDSVAISLDGYADRRTAYTFGVTAAGTRFDHYHPSDSESDLDTSFDPVWQAAVARDERGWTAELRIPLSQLMAVPAGTRGWGVNAMRRIAARNEDLYWTLVPSDESGWASRFGELAGIAGIDPRRRLELAPYLAVDATVAETRAADLRMGLDLRAPVGRHATVQATVFPDFGQVEADPAELNLTTNETVFEDKRPFFVDQRRLLEGGAIDDARYFYSRRLGAVPRKALAIAPAGTSGAATILGAAKLSVRTPSRTAAGVLIGASDRVTAADGTAVAPVAGFGIARIQQQLGADGSTVGAIATLVRRHFTTDDPTRALVAGTAASGGVDWNLRLADGALALSGDLGASQVRGTAEAIARVQQASQRYLQRPDRERGGFDPLRRSLGGLRGALRLERLRGTHWLWSVSGAVVSSGFELEDAGLLQQADRGRADAQLTYRENHARGPMRRYAVNFIGGATWNLEGTRIGTRAIIDTNTVWSNDWEVRTHAHVEPRAQSDRLTRGGPLMGTPRMFDGFVSFKSDPAARLRWAGQVFGLADEFGARSAFVSATSTYATGDLSVAIEPSMSADFGQRQYVTAVAGDGATTFGRRYLFGSLRRNTAAVAVRVGYALTPDLTFDLYASPYMTSGRYRRFGELAAPGSRRLRGYDSVSTGDAMTYDVSLRSTAVVRWEWAPGSTLFVVWQQDRAGGSASGDVAGPTLLGDAFTSPSGHTFSAKLSYWSQWL